ncbi:hypothetical protein MN116_006686 [Schistosoma mekongi]|uniref:Uncharacterized protein n=1 Tax=Schistosoma mekongi TaxID=38744 RepID=A0AAE1Z977_SCHME|nr:hypothetical protein MN116_006686 [Schistosoma mekongi]
MESIHQHSELKRHSDSNFLDIKRMDRDLIVMVVLIALTLIISIILIMTIFLIRCKHFLCITPFSRPNHNLPNHTNNSDNNSNQFTLGNHTIQSNNHNGTESIRGHWWNRSWNTKSLPKEYCVNKSGELLSTSCQDMYRTNTLEHCPEFNLLRCVQNTTSTSPCDHILLKDSTYRTLDPDTFKHNNSPQPCNSSFSFNTSTNTTTTTTINNNNNIINNINNDHNNNNKYNTISSLNNPIVNDYIIEMNRQHDDSSYTLLKASDIKYFNKELIYQPLCSTSLSSRQFCLTPIIYEHNIDNKQINDITKNSNNNNNNINNEKSIIDCLNKSPNKLNITQQFPLTNFTSSQLNEHKRKNMKI